MDLLFFNTTLPEPAQLLKAVYGRLLIVSLPFYLFWKKSEQFLHNSQEISAFFIFGHRTPCSVSFTCMYFRLSESLFCFLLSLLQNLVSQKIEIKRK